MTDFATNLGAGLMYRFNDWVGLSADYRTFFVHRADESPRVNRFTTGLTFSLKQSSRRAWRRGLSRPGPSSSTTLRVKESVRRRLGDLKSDLDIVMA